MLIQVTSGVIIGLLSKYGFDLCSSKELHRKQHEYLREMHRCFKYFRQNKPKNKSEIEERQRKVGDKASSLSFEIFKKPEPKLNPIRHSSTIYPCIKCKWCHQDHKAETGKIGKCQNCVLPFDIWIGCQELEN